MPPHLAAVVLNFRTPSDTVLAVKSLLASKRPVDRIVVVDNDTCENVREALEPRPPRVTYLLTGTNLGFAGGVNVGIRDALAHGADRVLLVNSDVIEVAGTRLEFVDAGAGSNRQDVAA